MSSLPFTPLSADSYLRMFQVIASTVEASDFPSSSACMFFANIGAHLMRVTHGLDAQAKAGVCAFRISEPGGTLSFGVIDHASRTAIPVGDRFHCWIECDGFVIDLMAPLYREMWQAATGSPEQLPRLMFQKPRTAMAVDIMAPSARGDFYVHEDATSTREMAHLVTTYARLHPGFDVVQACARWYAAAEGAELLGRTIELRNGAKKEVCLIPVRLSGVW